MLTPPFKPSSHNSAILLKRYKNIFQDREEEEMNLHEEIEKAAYELYEKSGRVGGRDLENWLEAEKATRARHGRKELVASAAKEIEQVAGAAARKVKKAVKETVTGLKSAAKKRI